MKVSFFPKTKPGKWSVWFFVGTIVAAVFLLVTSVFDQRGGDTFFSNPYLAYPIILLFITGFFAFATGIISVIKSKERSITVYITTIIGFLITLWGLMEVIFPH